MSEIPSPNRKAHKLLVVGLHYAPEPSGNAPYTSGLAGGLSDCGMNVRVLTGYPHYPQWRRYAGYDGWSMKEKWANVSVHRLRHFIPRVPTSLKRILMELSFGLRVASTKWASPDSILLVSPALIASALALVASRLRNRHVPVTIWVQDLYSLGITETGTSGSRTARAMAALESRVLRSADAVVVIHDRFRSYAVEHLGVNPQRIRVIRNWTHLNSFTPSDKQASRASFGWQLDDIIVLHAGNMGAKQGLDNVVNAARLAEAENSRVRFVLMGDGNQRSRLEELSRGVTNIRFVDPLATERFQEALTSADVLLVNELPGVKEMSVPSKLTSYFSSGVPVLAATDADSVTAEELSAADAGVRVDAGNPLALVVAAEQLHANTAEQERLAANGLRYVRTVLAKSNAVAQYNQYLTEVSASGRGTNSSTSRGDLIA